MQVGGLELDAALFVHVLDVSIIAYLIYRLLLVIRGTRAAPMLFGLSIITVVFFVAQPLGLVTLTWLIDNFLGSIILVIVVIFQDEIRRALTKVGVQSFLFKSGGKGTGDRVLEDIVLAATKLAKAQIGGLIVIQRDVGLDEFLEEAVMLDARLHRKLLYSIFVKDSPLHDGAVIVDGDRIKAAGCVLPLSFNPDLDPNLGTRHRAALGLSERSDAVVIVISEGTGVISLVRDGKLTRNLEAGDLRDLLEQQLSNGAVAKRTQTETKMIEA